MRREAEYLAGGGGGRGRGGIISSSFPKLNLHQSTGGFKASSASTSATDRRKSEEEKFRQLRIEFGNVDKFLDHFLLGFGMGETGALPEMDARLLNGLVKPEVVVDARLDGLMEAGVDDDAWGLEKAVGATNGDDDRIVLTILNGFPGSFKVST